MDKILSKLESARSPILKKTTLRTYPKSSVEKRVPIKSMETRYAKIQPYYKPICKLFK